MPLYEYQCSQCGTFELIQKFSDPTLTSCPTCGKDVHKLPSAPAIQFKGSGWYITDYARKSSGGDDGAAASKDSSKDSKDSKDSSKDSSKESSKDSSKDKSSSTPSTTSSKDSSATGSSPTK